VLADGVRAFHERAVIGGGLRRIAEAGSCQSCSMSLTVSVYMGCGIDARLYWQQRPELFIVSHTRMQLG